MQLETVQVTLWALIDSKWDKKRSFERSIAPLLSSIKDQRRREDWQNGRRSEKMAHFASVLGPRRFLQKARKSRDPVGGFLHAKKILQMIFREFHALSPFRFSVGSHISERPFLPGQGGLQGRPGRPPKAVKFVKIRTKFFAALNKQQTTM